MAEVRHVEWCWHPRERDWLHALVAAVRDVDGRLVAVSRLFLDDSGRKARCRPVRMFLGAVTGAAFKTSGPGVRGRVVTLCEGVEDALAASMIWPWRWAWACLSAGGLERVELPAGMSAVIVPDRDRVGMLAARRAADRLRGEGRLVEIVEPPLGDACESLQLCDLLGLEATAL